MRRRTKRRILKIIATGKNMRAADARAQEETGLRHVPTEAFFKAKRKHEKALERLTDEEIFLVWCMVEFMKEHTYMAPSPAAMEDFHKTRRRLGQIFTPDGALAALKDTDYLDEELETALYVLKSL